MDFDTSLKVLHVRMWEKGHSFDEIRSMSLEDIGDVIGYWSEDGRAEHKLADEKRRLSKHKK